MKKSTYLGFILIIFPLIVFIYTLFVIKSEGCDLFSIFFNNIISISWSGQFNLDFMCYLFFSGLWIMWRNHFQLKFILLALIASVLGIIFFAPYVFSLYIKENGNLKKVLVGNR